MNATEPRRQPLLRVVEIAERCNVSARTVRDWIAQGSLEALRFSPRSIRVSPAAFERFLEASALA